MREIKFRCFRDGQMVQLDQMNTSINENPDFQKSDGPVMQFTGLLDKNGKEIWEGDIIERSDFGVIEFDGGMFGVNWDFGTDRKSMLGAWATETNLRCLHDGYSREIEVIGNIYQNPELIK